MGKCSPASGGSQARFHWPLPTRGLTLFCCFLLALGFVTSGQWFVLEEISQRGCPGPTRRVSLGAGSWGACQGRRSLEAGTVGPGGAGPDSETDSLWGASPTWTVRSLQGEEEPLSICYTSRLPRTAPAIPPTHPVPAPLDLSPEATFQGPLRLVQRPRLAEAGFALTESPAPSGAWYRALHASILSVRRLDGSALHGCAFTVVSQPLKCVTE